MKYIRYILICTLLYNGVFVFSQHIEKEYKIFYYNNGNKSSEGWLEHSKPNGYWKNYYLNGKLKSEGNRENYLLDGKWIFYKEDGNIDFTVQYKNGKKHGVKTIYLPDYYVEEQFDNDIKQGITKYFDYQDRIFKKVPYNEGVEDGLAKEYDTTGLIIAISNYKSGFIVQQEIINRKDNLNRKQGIWKWFDNKERLLKEAEYKNDELHGYVKTYDINGNLLTLEKYNQGVKQENVDEITPLDIVKDYYPSGKIKIIGSYKNDVPQGVRREFDENGVITQSYIYDNGKIIGEGIIDAEGLKQGNWKHFYKEGFIKSKGKYKNNLPMGEWIYFFPEEKIEQQGKYYPAGKPDGNWKWYYESGQIKIDENYEKGILQGNYIEYDESGNILVEGVYLDGNKEGKWKYNIGDYRSEGFYREDMMFGEWKGYFDNGQIAFEGSYINDLPDGKHIYYYSNGKIQLMGKYEMGKKEGEWKKYTEEGDIYIRILYKQGQIIAFEGVNVIE